VRQLGTSRRVATRDDLTHLVQAAFGTDTRLRHVVDLAGDASSRRYQRLFLAGENAPPTAVVMLLADRAIALSSDELALFPEPPRELPFINVHRFLSGIGIDVPAVYLDESERGLVLLEDVGDASLREVVSASPPARVRELYERSIEQLVQLILDGTRHADPNCIAFRQRFDRRLYLWEFEHFLQYGVEQRLQTPLPERERSLLLDHFTAIAERLDAAPKFLAHRDYHSWNLFVQGQTRIRVLDFQDALLAAPAYDLATLLGDRDTPTLVPPALEEQLLDYFLDCWEARGGPPLAPAEFQELYFLCALQKALKVVGRFYFLATEKNKPQYLRYIPATVRQILRLLPKFPEHRPMADLLRKLLPE